ncbi:uncharacterized protein METZ01_LOCUS474305 [marine metagenome]|uniref:Uncharacterized protein n=1 Tax=marine metagenome TaxID=408172 RepID=A0A383BNN6_9ZZZZ
MPLKAKSKNIVTTARGKKIDFEKLRRANETATAVGNVPVNARGDEIGPGGKIIKKREEIIKEYYATNPKAVANTQAKPQPPIEETKTVDNVTYVKRGGIWYEA